MPTTKPILQAVLDEDYKRRFDKICEAEGRTKSSLASIIIKQWIDNHDNEIEKNENRPKIDNYKTIKVTPEFKKELEKILSISNEDDKKSTP